jgi:hypothetical protein
MKKRKKRRKRRKTVWPRQSLVKLSLTRFPYFLWMILKTKPKPDSISDGEQFI